LKCDEHGQAAPYIQINQPAKLRQKQRFEMNVGYKRAARMARTSASRSARSSTATRIEVDLPFNGNLTTGKALDLSIPDRFLQRVE